MNIYVAELIGTAIMIFIGSSVVANVVLEKSKGQNSGWIVITAAWGFGVMAGVYAVGRISGGHLNSAFTISLAIIGQFPWKDVPGYIIAQIMGAMIGAGATYLTYKKHFDATENKEGILAIFATGPAIRDYKWNIMSEIMGTFLLVFGLLIIGVEENNLGSLGPLIVGLFIWALGLAIGGPTGYAINPARDLGPRIMHSLLPIKNKGGSDWAYAIVPIVGPIIGGVIGALLFKCVYL